MTPDPFNGLVGSSGFLYSQCAWYNGTQYTYNNNANWSSNNTGIATVQTKGQANPGLTFGAGAGSASISSFAQSIPTNAGQICGSPGPPACPVAAPTQSGPANMCSVAINSILPYSDQISTTLSGPAGATGTAFIWEVNGSATNYSLNGQSRGSGTFNDGFQLTSSSATGQYSAVYAAWNACSYNAVTSSPHNFFNWGNTLHTQYAVIWENTCSNTQNKAYIITNLGACFSRGLVTTTLSSQFESQVAINGTGQSKSYGVLKALAATSCAGATTNKPSDSTNANTFVEISGVTGSCNVSLSNTTVAQYSSSGHVVNCGQQELLRGYPSSPGTLKAVEDRCPACSNTAGSAHFDNFNPTQGAPSCGLGSIPTLGSFVTVTDGQLPAQPQ